MARRKVFEQITVDPKVRFGKPIIAGTRIPVDLIVGKIAAGMSTEEIMREYDLTKQQVLATLSYAAKLVAEEAVTFA